MLNDVFVFLCTKVQVRKDYSASLTNRLFCLFVCLFLPGHCYNSTSASAFCKYLDLKISFYSVILHLLDSIFKI